MRRIITLTLLLVLLESPVSRGATVVLDGLGNGQFGRGGGQFAEGAAGENIMDLNPGDMLTLLVEGTVKSNADDPDYPVIPGGRAIGLIRLTTSPTGAAAFTKPIFADPLGFLFADISYPALAGTAPGSVVRTALAFTEFDFTPHEEKIVDANDAASNPELQGLTGTDMPNYGGFAFTASPTARNMRNDDIDHGAIPSTGDLLSTEVFLPGESNALFTSTAFGLSGDGYQFKITALQAVSIGGIVNDPYAINNGDIDTGNNNAYTITTTYVPVSTGGGGEVPEPGTIAIWGLLGLCGIAAARRRRNRK